MNYKCCYTLFVQVEVEADDETSASRTAQKVLDQINEHNLVQNLEEEFRKKLNSFEICETEEDEITEEDD